MAIQPSCDTLVILLGAENFPLIPRFKSSEAFKNSCRGLRDYFLSGSAFNLAPSNMLDLFDSNLSGTQMLNAIEDWLQAKKDTAKQQNIPIENLIIYYVGHGGFKGNTSDYYLAIHTTREARPYYTSLQIEALTEVTALSFSHIRRYFIVDACFAGSAIKNAQGPADPKSKVEQTNRAIIGATEKDQAPLPKRGTSFLCAVSEKDVAAFGKTYTYFSEALLNTLTQRSDIPIELSFEQLKNYSVSFIDSKHGKAAPGLPELHSPDQREGDIAKVFLFPRQRQKGKLPKRILWRADGKVMVLITHGEKPAFYIDECPVSRTQYETALADRQPAYSNVLEEARGQDDGIPKVSITAQQAQKYAKKVRKQLVTVEQWGDLIQQDPDRYSSSGAYLPAKSTANLSGKGVQPVRKHPPQHKEALWDIVGNTFELIHDDSQPSSYYKVSSFHSSPQLEAFDGSPTTHRLSVDFAHNTLGFRTAIPIKDPSLFESPNPDALIILEEDL